MSESSSVMLSYAKLKGDLVHFNDGRVAEIRPESLPAYVTIDVYRGAVE